MGFGGGRVCVEFLHDTSFVQVPRLAHHREYARIVELLVDLQESVDVLPPSGGTHILQREKLSLDRPLPAVRMP